MLQEGMCVCRRVEEQMKRGGEKGRRRREGKEGERREGGV